MGIANSCAVGARYTMQADVYEQTASRNPDTGQTIRRWSFVETINCQARGVISEGIRTVGSTEEYRASNWSYEDVDWVKLKSGTQLSKRWMITNIRNFKSTDPIWYDVETEQPIYFDVMGSQPLPNPFGTVVEYENLLYRKQDGLTEQIE